jgi:hypothetical protein
MTERKLQAACNNFKQAAIITILSKIFSPQRSSMNAY